MKTHPKKIFRSNLQGEDKLLIHLLSMTSMILLQELNHKDSQTFKLRLPCSLQQYNNHNLWFNQVFSHQLFLNNSSHKRILGAKFQLKSQSLWLQTINHLSNSRFGEPLRHLANLSKAFGTLLLLSSLRL